MSRIQAVVFDLDGTLVDSLEDIASVVNATLVEHGREPHPLEAYKTMVGWGLKSLLVKASAKQPFAPLELGLVHEDLMRAYRARPVTKTKAYSGIDSLLASIGSSVPMGVLSNKEDGMTKTIIGVLFPETGFQTVWGADPKRASKPDPRALLEMLDGWKVAPSQCAYLGDSDVDMQTALGAGVIACGASWGFRSAEELTSAGAAQVFESADSFGRWLIPRLGSVESRLG